MSYSAKLRQLLDDQSVIRFAGAHNALSARLVEKNSFDGIWASGFEISTTHAVPDASILSMSDFLEAARNMVDAVNLPVIADCDTGFGNATNVIHMIKKYQAAGVAGVCIEDKPFPKVNSFIPGRQELAPLDEFAGKIMAAKNAQTNTDFFLIARVEALIAGHGLDEALKRAHTYVDAGADAILMHSKVPDAKEIFQFLEKWKNKCPVVLVPTEYPNYSADDLFEAGAKIIIYANQGLRASVKAMDETFARIHASRSSKAVEASIAPMKDLFELQGMPVMKEHEDRFVKTGKPKIRAVIAAAGVHASDLSLKSVTQDKPVTMIDLQGQTLLERNVEALMQNKISDIQVTTGHLAEKIINAHVKTNHSKNWKKKGQLYSFIQSIPHKPQALLLTYGDILFEAELVARLIKSPFAITLAIDRSFAQGSRHEVGKAELVEFSKTSPDTKRHLTQHPIAVAIGKDLNPQQANGEFCGLLYLSEEGCVAFKEAYRNAGNTKTFNVDQAGLVDLLQLMIDKGV